MSRFYPKPLIRAKPIMRLQCCLLFASDAPVTVNIAETAESDAVPRRGCWWAQKVGEDYSRPTNVVPALRKSPIELPVIPHPRDLDISQVIVRSSLSSHSDGE